jgi:small membrane protein
MSRQSAIQILLIAAVLAIAWRLLIGSGQRTQALRRLGLLFLLGLVIYSIIDPSNTWTNLATTLGVGRGADLILYGLVVAFLGFVVTTYKRFRDMEIRYTRLARRIALDEAPPASEHTRSTVPPDTLSADVTQPPSVKAADAD